VSIHPPLARVAVAVRPYLSWISGVALVLLAGIGVRRIVSTYNVLNQTLTSQHPWHP